MTPRQIDVLRLLIENDKITYEEMKDKLGIKYDGGIVKHINNQKTLGAVERTQTFGGKWIVKFEKGEE